MISYLSELANHVKACLNRTIVCLLSEITDQICACTVSDFYFRDFLRLVVWTPTLIFTEFLNLPTFKSSFVWKSVKFGKQAACAFSLRVAWPLSNTTASSRLCVWWYNSARRVFRNLMSFLQLTSPSSWINQRRPFCLPLSEVHCSDIVQPLPVQPRACRSNSSDYRTTFDIPILSFHSRSTRCCRLMSYVQRFDSFIKACIYFYFHLFRLLRFFMIFSLMSPAMSVIRTAVQLIQHQSKSTQVHTWIRETSCECQCPCSGRW